MLWSGLVCLVRLKVKLSQGNDGSLFVFRMLEKVALLTLEERDGESRSISREGRVTGPRIFILLHEE